MPIVDCGLRMEGRAEIAMTPEEMKNRTMRYGIRIIRLAEALPRGRAGDLVAKQLVACGTSVGANYSAVCRAKSMRDFVAKLSIVEEEADESLYWLDVIVEAGLMKAPRVEALKKEGEEILSMVVAGIQTARKRAAR